MNREIFEKMMIEEYHFDKEDLTLLDGIYLNVNVRYNWNLLNNYLLRNNNGWQCNG